MREHYKDCPGMKITCFCDTDGLNKMTVRELNAHLKKECG